MGWVGFSPPGIWGFSWTYFNQRGRLCPPNYCLPTRIRKPSGISVLSALHCTQQLMNQKMVLKTEFKCIFTNNAFFIVVCMWLSILESNLSLLVKTSFLTFPQYCFSNYVGGLLNNTIQQNQYKAQYYSKICIVLCIVFHFNFFFIYFFFILLTF